MAEVLLSMSISYEISGDLLYVTFEGSTETKEILDMLERAFADPALPHECRLLLDVSGSASLQERSSNNVHMLTMYVGRWVERLHGRMAVLAEGPVQYGMVRMASGYATSSGLDIQVFKTREEALAWLTEPPDAA